MLAALQRGAHILIRFEFATIRLLDEAGTPISPAAAKERLAPRGPVDFPVWLPGREQPLRAIGDRNDKGEPVWLITDLTSAELDNSEVRSLYSLRWQIELFFKRLKSLLDLDELPTRDGPTAKPWIWAKLILATLAVLMADERFSPWGRAFEPIGMGAFSQGSLDAHVSAPDLLKAPKDVAA
jgi:IS4 transposase